MCNLNLFSPHREELPIRRCTDCSAILSTGNTTSQCWPCGKSWNPVFRDTQIAALFAAALQDYDAIPA
jgi:hypothetical protein